MNNNENQPLPPKVTGGWIESLHDIPDYIWEQAKADFTGFYEKLQDFVVADVELVEALEDYDFTLSDRDFYEQQLKLNRKVTPPVKRSGQAGLNAVLGYFTRKQGEAFARSLGWEPTVRFKLRELKMREKAHIGDLLTRLQAEKPVTMGLEITRAVLWQLEGVDDPATGKPLKLKSETVAKITTIDDAVLNKIPETLLPEIVEAMKNALSLTDEEEEEVNFTSASSSGLAASPAASATSAEPPSRKSESAPTDAEPEESS